MATPKKPIHILGNLDEDESGIIILRGSIDPDCLPSLRIDWYQRESGFSRIKIKRMIAAILRGETARLPDIILGMRGHKWESTKESFLLHDPVYQIDGVQRWTAACLAMREHPHLKVRLGAKVYFGTTVDIEREMFRALNTGHTATAPSVILRNEKEVSRVAGSLYGMSHQPNFALKNRVCWNQVLDKGRNGQLVRGVSLLQILIELHHHRLLVGGTGGGGGGVLDLLRLVDSRIDQIGLQQARENLVEFFEVLDDVWGARALPRWGSTHLTQGWMRTLARVFDRHKEFWRNDEKALTVNAQYRRELQKLDPEDPELKRLAGGNQNGQRILYNMMIELLNKGKSRHRLVERKPFEDDASRPQA